MCFKYNFFSGCEGMLDALKIYDTLDFAWTLM